jgi:hypothetical protein
MPHGSAGKSAPVGHLRQGLALRLRERLARARSRRAVVAAIGAPACPADLVAGFGVAAGAHHPRLAERPLAAWAELHSHGDVLPVVAMAATAGAHWTWHHPGGVARWAIGWPMVMSVLQMVQTLARRALRTRSASGSGSARTRRPVMAGFLS